MADDTRSVTVDSKSRVSLGDLVKPGEQYAAWRNEHGQIIMAPSVTIIRTPENAAVLDQVEAFLKNPSTGVRRDRPIPRATEVSLALVRAQIAEDEAQAARDQQTDRQWSAMDRSEGGRG